MDKLHELEAEARRVARSNEGSSRASGRGSEEQGIGLRLHHFYSSTDAARNCRITHRSDLVRDHVGDGGNSERSRFHDRDRFLSAVDSAERERPSLRGRDAGADSAWGLIAIGVASFASLVENLIEAGNILGSVFYGSILGLFLAAFFMRRVTGSAVFFRCAACANARASSSFVTTNIGYLWYNFIGCAAVLILAPILQQTLFRSAEVSAGV